MYDANNPITVDWDEEDRPVCECDGVCFNVFYQTVSSRTFDCSNIPPDCDSAELEGTVPGDPILWVQCANCGRHVELDGRLLDFIRENE